jgi:hypothetical protein
MVSIKKIKRVSVSDLYAMQRANGDVFALEDHGRFRVPLFHSSHDAMMARLRNFGMLLFKPVALDARLLKEIVPVGDAAELDFWLVNDPLVSLNRGHLIEYAQLAPLMHRPIELRVVPRNGDSFDIPILTKLPQSEAKATESWEDEGGKYSKCA